MIVCQKYNIITNPTAQNKCSEFDYNNNNGTVSHIIDTTKFSLTQTIIEDINLSTKINNDIDSTIIKLPNESELEKGLNTSTMITNEIDSTIIKLVNESELIKGLNISTIVTNEFDSTTLKIANESELTKGLNISTIIINEIDSTISPKKFITPSIIYTNSTSIYTSINSEDLTIPITQEKIYVINSRVFLLGYTNFNIINSNIFSFFIYFMAPKTPYILNY